MPGSRSHRYLILDVFTQVPLEGNALAVFPDSAEMDDQTMQRIARELNLSETVFVQPPTKPGCVACLRIFNPKNEMLFAGHPTIGAAFVLRSEGMVPLECSEFSLDEKIGAVPVRVEASAPPIIWLETPPITSGKSYEASLCAEVLSLSPGDLLPVPPQLLSAGNPTLYVAVRGKADVDRSSVNSEAFARLKATPPSPSCLFVFTPTAEGAYSRMFAPDYGIPEDPASGSLTGPLAFFMREHKLLPQSENGRYVSEQGTKMGRRSLLLFEFTPAGVGVGGHAVTVGEGVIRL